MSHGSLFINTRNMAFYAGAIVPGGKLYFTQTGTATALPVYTTADLSVAHSSPVDADANGQFPTIYLDPDAAVDYRVKLADADNVALYTDEAVPRRSENFETDTFTVTYTGFSSDPAADTATWFKFGSIVNLILPVGSGTSNTTGFVMDGLPAALQPDTAQYCHLPLCQDNSAYVAGGAVARITSSSSIVLSIGGAAFGTTNWTAGATTKGLDTVGDLWYRLHDS